MEENEILDYVKASARALGLALNDERAAAVALHLGRSMAVARVLEQVPLAPHHELAQIYVAAPFPAEDGR
jgi:hypothetical protein